MSRKKKPNRAIAESEPKTQEGDSSLASLPLLACYAAFAALLVATPLTPGEGAADLGSGNLLAAGWVSLAACWLAIAALKPAQPYHLKAALLPIAGLACWHVVSLAAHQGVVHARPAVNMTLVWAGTFSMVFVGLQLFQTEAARRTVVALLIIVATGLALHGFHQYFVSMPRTERDFKNASEAEKQRILQSHGLDPSPDSPERKHFIDRLEATEPFATFGLANSLAGFLAPLAVLTLGVAWRELLGRCRLLSLAAMSLMLLVILACLTLTKSRTAYLALFAGVAVLIYLLGFAQRLDWRWLTIGVASIGALGLFGVAVGALDIEVLSESSKSLRYRLEYWRASAMLVAEAPWFGCGPGQFQAVYTRYKLPEASETVADPHNFIIETAATLGLPGLLFLAGVAALLLREFWARGEMNEVDGAACGTLASSSSFAEVSSRAVRTALLVGGGLGVLVGIVAGATVDHVPDFWAILMLLIAFAAGAAWVWTEFELPREAVSAALITWIVNLSAAGGWNFPGVAIVGWLLVSLLLCEGCKGAKWRPGRPLRLLLLLLAAGVVWSSMRWGTRPLEARTILNSPLMRNSYTDARRLCLEAANRDPLWADPWSRLAAVEHQHWLRDGSSTAKSRFDEAIEQMLQRDSVSWTRRFQAGHWFLSAWRLRGDPTLLQSARSQYEAARASYPNHILIQAQLAWTSHLAGDSESASEYAQRALELDDQHPHQEHKLDRQRVYDPGRILVLPGQPAPPRSPDAEPLMRQLRRGEIRGAAFPDKSPDN